MRHFYKGVVRHRKVILIVFLALAVVSVFLSRLVNVDYDMTDYLPEGSPSTVALEVLGTEFSGGIPNARVMISNVSIAEALEYKAALEAVNGVTAVNWLDDAADITQPLETMDADTVESWYVDGNAVFLVTLEDDVLVSATDDIRALIGDDNAMTGTAISTAVATNSTITEVALITGFSIVFALFVLAITTASWIEPLIVLLGLVMAVVINAGTNLLFGTISFVTNAAGSILQLAVSLDYSVFLLHRFTELQSSYDNEEDAMVEALCRSTTSILSSGLTTVIGFLALCLMRYRIGPDLGLALAKGVTLSLITVFVFSPALILTMHKLITRTKHRPLLPSFLKFGGFVRRVMLPMAVIFAIVLVPSYLASVHNNYYFGASHIFGPETQLGQDTTAIEDIFGKSDSYVLLVPQGDIATEKALSDALHEIPEVTSIISYVDSAGETIPTAYLDDDTLSQLMSGNYSRMVLSVDADCEGSETTALIDTIRAAAQSYYPDSYYLAGAGVSTYDLQNTITADMTSVNLVAIGAVLLVLILTMRALVAPILLVLSIETAIWINLSLPYFTGTTVFYIAYLIISTIQLGATVDYAILFSDRYREMRRTYNKKEAIRQTVSAVTVSIMTSASAMAVVGFLMGRISTHGILSQMGYFLGVGTLCSLAIVLFVLPGLLYLFDRLIIPGGKKRRDRPHPAKHTKGRHLMKKTHKTASKRLTAGFLACALILCIGTAAYADGSQPSEKEEVVYVMADASGAVDSIYVVNIFGAGSILDYGDYTSVKLLNTTDDITQNGDEITFHTDTERVYYQAALDSTDIPWNITLTYTLDGIAVEPEALAGRSGALEIHFTVSQNAAYNGPDFFNNYSLQASLTLDTENCSNIVAEDATIANVGTNKQLSFTVLPGKALDTTISADVTDFEMAAAAINAIPLSLDVSVDTTDLTEKTTELQDGITALDDGAQSLAEGVEELNTGAQSLQSSVNGALTEGVGELNTGLSSLYAGLSKLDDNSAALLSGAYQAFQGLCTAAQTPLNSQLSEAGLPTVSLTPESYADVLNSLMAQMGGVTYETVEQRVRAEVEATALATVTEAVDADLNNVCRQALEAADPESAAAIYQGAAQMLAVQAAILLGVLPAEATEEEQAAYLSSPVGTAAVAAILLVMTDETKSTAVATALSEEQMAALRQGVIDNQMNSAETQASIDAAVSSAMADESIQQQMADADAAYDAVAELKAQLDSYATFYAGLRDYTDGVYDAKSGAADAVDGGLSLYSSVTNTLSSGVSQLADGAAELNTGAAELTDGTGTLTDSTSGLDTVVQDEVDKVIDGLTGSGEVGSFVSDKNTNVTSVQFVIKTAAITAHVTENTTPANESDGNLTFWQKLAALFR